MIAYSIIRQLHIRSLLGYASPWIAAFEFHKIIIIIMLKYIVVFTVK